MGGKYQLGVSGGAVECCRHHNFGYVALKRNETCFVRPRAYLELIDLEYSCRECERQDFVSRGLEDDSSGRHERIIP